MNIHEQDHPITGFITHHTGDKEKPVYAELLINKGDDRIYSLSVGKTPYIEQLKAYNEALKPGGVRIFTQILPLNEIPAVDAIEDLLKEISRIPAEHLDPFLTEQVIPEESGE